MLKRPLLGDAIAASIAKPTTIAQQVPPTLKIAAHARGNVIRSARFGFIFYGRTFRPSTTGMEDRIQRGTLSFVR
jgi:hypothetical protein